MINIEIRKEKVSLFRADFGLPVITGKEILINEKNIYTFISSNISDSFPDVRM